MELHEAVQGHGLIFRMVPYAYKAPVRVYDDGCASVHRHLARPDKPLLIEVEGSEPTPEQLAVLANIYLALSRTFTFTASSFCDTLLPHANLIMGKLEMPPAA